MTILHSDERPTPHKTRLEMHMVEINGCWMFVFHHTSISNNWSEQAFDVLMIP